MPTDFRSKIDQIISETGFSMNRINRLAGFGQGTLRAAYEENRELSEDKLVKLLNNLEINHDWWTTGKGDVFLQKDSHVEYLDRNTEEKGSRETFYVDLIERNDNYSLIPRAVLKDYKIVPDKIIDEIIKSKENEKEALLKTKDMVISNKDQEIETLNRKYELMIQGLKNQVASLEKENETLKKHKD